MEKRRRYTIRTFAALVIALLLIIGVYEALDGIPVDESDPNLKRRGIDIGLRLWFNGYLGHFFRFGYVGNLNWLMIPVLGWSVWKFRSLERWEKAFLFMYLMTFAMIAARGYFNMRYNITLFPITLTAILYFLWKLFDDEAVKFLRIPVFGCMLLLGLYNTYRYKFQYPSDHRIEMDAGMIKFCDLGSRGKAENYVCFPEQNEERSLIGRVEDKLLTISATVFPTRAPNIRIRSGDLYTYERSLVHIMDFIDSIPLPDNHYILTNNLPSVYYYTHQKALYYWCHDDLYYTNEGTESLLKRRSAQETAAFLVDSLNCDYLFSFKPYNLYNPTWMHFLEMHCERIACDLNGYEVYRIRP